MTDRRHRLADHGGVLLLSVHAALGAGRDDAAAVGGVRPQRRRASPRWSASSTTAIRRSAWSRAWRWTSSGPRRSSRSARRWSASGRCCSRRATAALASVGPVPAGRGRRVRAGRRGLHRDDELPGVARGDADRRDADVRHGRRIGRAVRGRAADRRRRRLEHVLGRDGRRRPRDRRAALLPSAGAGTETSRRDGWLQSAVARARHRLPESAVDPVRRDRRACSSSRRRSSTWSGACATCRRRTASTTRRRSCARHGPVRLDHRLPAARLHFRPARPAQAGDHRRRARCCSACLAWILYGPAGCLSSLRRSASWPASRRARRCCPTP